MKKQKNLNLSLFFQIITNSFKSLKNKLIIIIQYISFLCIGLFLFYLSFKNQNISKIIEDLKGVRYKWIILSASCATISHLIRAMRWNLLIQPLGYKTKISTSFYAVIIGYLANFAIPRIGEITRCGVISKQNKIPFNPILGTVIVERIFDLISLIVILLFVVLLQWNLLSGYMSRFFILNNKNNLNFYFLVLLILILFLIGFPFLYKKLLKPTLKKFNFYIKLRTIFYEFIFGVKSIRKVNNIKKFTLLTISLWFFYVLSIYCCFYSIAETSQLTFVDAISVMAIGSIGVVAPVPGGIGAYHFIVKTLLNTIYHIDSNAALSLATISHAVQLFTILILSGLSFILIFRQSHLKIKNEKY